MVVKALQDLLRRVLLVEQELLTQKRKGDTKSRILSRTSDTTETRNTIVIKVILLACFTYIAIFKFYQISSEYHLCALC
jgi:hypothetical protein